MRYQYQYVRYQVPALELLPAVVVGHVLAPLSQQEQVPLQVHAEQVPVLALVHASVLAPIHAPVLAPIHVPALAPARELVLALALELVLAPAHGQLLVLVHGPVPALAQVLVRAQVQARVQALHELALAQVLARLELAQVRALARAQVLVDVLSELFWSSSQQVVLAQLLLVHGLVLALVEGQLLQVGLRQTDPKQMCQFHVKCPGLNQQHLCLGLQFSMQNSMNSNAMSYNKMKNIHIQTTHMNEQVCHVLKDR